MGGQPSKPPVTAAESEKLILERLRSFRVEEGEYVKVGRDTEKMDHSEQAAREPEGLPVSLLELWLDHVMKDPKNRLAHAALSSSDPRQALLSRSTKIANQQVFNIQIPFEGDPITNQRSSGRCWLFASTNVFRVALMKRHNLESFELSQAYLFYWDKLEKANWFLEQIVQTAKEDLDSRVVQRLLGDIVSDGGQWDMVYNLVEKYGLVPQALYPDSWNAMNSSILNSIIKTKLRGFAVTLREVCNGVPMPPSAIGDHKAFMLQEIALIMTLLLGQPPKPSEEFTWQYLDKDGKSRELKTTPKAFSKDIYSSEFRVTSDAIQSMISLVHDPRHDPLRKLTVSRLGNIVGGRNITYVNVEMETLKSTCVKMLKSGVPIFFGCDVGKFSDRVAGIMDLDLFDYEAGFNISLLGMTKAERLMTGESLMTHAMVLTAVHLDEKTGKPVRWRVQNSWGTAAGDKGWFVMSDAWMDEFVYQAVVDPRFCSKEVRDVLKQEPIVLPLWDPMGSLA
ncbi:bleomycin hydrolase [Trichoderma arundinaceum]|uniref:Cysteine proteinase 1, mitochondrial n=1 Tax=Trichoderma arundinaceum TaxID=490622 RepID=A0A395NA17_TRIAR|nr:bleomycin hydrolase [Trichoderma arundinaceum]